MASELEKHNDFVDLTAIFFLKNIFLILAVTLSLIKQQALNKRLAYLLDTRTTDLWTHKNQEN